MPKMPPAAPMALDRQVELYAELLALAEKQRGALVEGRLEDFLALVQDREMLLRGCGKPDPRTEDPALRERAVALLNRLVKLDRANAARLQEVMRQTAGQITGLAEARRSQAAYRKTLAPKDREPRILDRNR